MGLQQTTVRWYVEISSVGAKTASVTHAKTLQVFATGWEDAVKNARKRTGLTASLAGFSINLCDDGVHVIDPIKQLRYVVRRADARPIKSGSSGVMDAAKGCESVRAPKAAQASELAEPPLPLMRLSSAPRLHKPDASSRPSASTQPSDNYPGASSQFLSSSDRVSQEPTSSSYSRGQVVEMWRREDLPTAELPLVYGEYTYAVVPCTESQATAFVYKKLAQVQASLKRQHGAKLISITVFDHVYRTRPLRAPLVVLVWKDWKGPAEVYYPALPGASIRPAALDIGDVSHAPSSIPYDPNSVDSFAITRPRDAPDIADQDAMEPLPLLSPQDKLRARLRAHSSQHTDGTAPQSPPETLEALYEASDHEPNSKGSTRGAVIRRVVDALEHLRNVRDVYEAAEFVVDLAHDAMGCDLAMMQLFDEHLRQFVVVHAMGPDAENALGCQTSDRDEWVRSLPKNGRPVLCTPASAPGMLTRRWKRVGVVPATILACVIVQGDRVLGIVEAAHELSDASFRPVDHEVLARIAEAYAAFFVASNAVFSAEGY